AELVRDWDAARWSATYAPGKWTAAEIVLHLAQDEIGFGNRVRFALTQDNYVIQPYEGADWVAVESPTDPRVALAAFLALRRLNLILYKSIPAERRARSIAHPEFAEISIDWILHTLAGHDLHHLQHLRAIAAM
ncbi:MAG: DinB family protein, partial [Vicinamibacteria bacterium]